MHPSRETGNLSLTFSSSVVESFLVKNCWQSPSSSSELTVVSPCLLTDDCVTSVFLVWPGRTLTPLLISLISVRMEDGVHTCSNGDVHLAVIEKFRKKTEFGGKLRVGKFFKTVQNRSKLSCERCTDSKKVIISSMSSIQEFLQL